MVRKYNRKQGSTPYLTGYTAKQMDKAILDVKSGKSTAKSALDNGVPRSTLRDRMSGLHSKRHGGQLYLSEGLERAVLMVLNQLSSWKHPLNTVELRHLIRNYLNLCGVKSQFQDNLPGRDWAKSFIARHSLSERFPSKIKPKRASLTKEEILKYFENLEESLEGVDPANIFNFDETNFTDDPKRTKCIVRRGASRHERVEPHSKTAFSVMFCGSAKGVHLPPMVVYKAKNMYEGWKSTAISGAVYEATESGWFDMKTFEIWYFHVFLPHVKHVNGPIVLIGDNLSCHFSPKVIESCQEHGIRFVALLPNSTHLLQPLDVAVFRPMKGLWRACLSQWRLETRLQSTIPKVTFPMLLARVFKQLKSENLLAGFKAAGVWPLDSAPVLKHLAGSRNPEGEEMHNILNEACLQLLSQSLAKSSKDPKLGSRGRKVEAGKAIRLPDITWTCEECQGDYADDEENDGDRWLVCDNRKCNLAFHLQCSGLDYEENEYWDLDIDNLPFLCKACQGSKKSKKSKKGKK